MNVHVKKPVLVAARFGAGAAAGVGPARIAQASVVPIAEGVSAVIFDAAANGGGRIGGEISGLPLPRPVVSMRLPLLRGGVRYVLLVAQCAERLAASHCRLTLDAAPIATVDPDGLQPPLAGTTELIDGLTDDGRLRLLRMFVTTAASLFAVRRVSGYGAAVGRLVGQLGASEIRPLSVCALGAGDRLLSYRLPPGAPVPETGALVALCEDKVSRIASAGAHVERDPRGLLIHVVAQGGAPARRVIGFAPEPLILAVPALAAAKPLAPWLARRPITTRVWIEGLVDAAAARDPFARGLARELRHVAAPPPDVVVRHLSATPRGVLALVDLVDPHALVTGLRFDWGGAALDLRVDGRPRPSGGRVTLGCYLDAAAPIPAGAACRLRLIYGSGRIRTVGATRLAAYAGTLPDAFADAFDRPVAVAALAAARLALRPRDLAPVVAAIGTAHRRARLSLVVAAGASPDVLRAWAAMLSREPHAGAVDLIYHAGADRANAVKRVLAECHMVFGLACRIVILPDDADPAARLRTALALAQGPAALVLGADVLPAAAGWLAVWTKALRRADGPAILGGTLLATDGAVADAGGTVTLDDAVDTARIGRRWTGLPIHGLAFAPTMRTDVVTSDCVGLTRSAVAALVASGARYPNPDIPLLDLALRLRRAGRGARTLRAGRFVRYGDAVGAHPLGEAVDAQALAILAREVGRTGGA